MLKSGKGSPRPSAQPRRLSGHRPARPGASPGDAPLGESASHPAPARQRLAARLRESNASSQAIARCVLDMHEECTHTLDLSDQALDAAAIARLAQLFHDQPALLAPFTAIDVSGARLGVLWPLLKVLEEQQNLRLESLDFSGTRVLNTDFPIASEYEPLQPDDLQRIANIVARCPTLQTVKLNQQPGLSTAGPTHWAAMAGAKRSSPITTLAIALGCSWVKSVELRGCGLGIEDLEQLDRDAIQARENARDRPPGKGLRSLDLRDNDGMFEGFSAVCAVGVVGNLLTALGNNRSLQVLLLPSNAQAALGHDEDIVERLRALAQSRKITLAPLFLPIETPSLSTAAAGQQMANLLVNRDIDGAVALWKRMREAGLSTLDLSGQLLSAQEVRCLAQVFQTLVSAGWALGGITAFDFSNTRIEGGIGPLFQALGQFIAWGGVLAALDASGSRVVQFQSSWGRDPDRLWQAADWAAITEFVSSCTTLRVLKLDKQPGLSRDAGWFSFALRRPGAKDWPMQALTQALATSGVVELSLRHCRLKYEDVELLHTAVSQRQAGSGLRVIDLRGNKEVFAYHDLDNPHQLVIDCVAAALKNPDLQVLRLSKNALGLCDDDKAADELARTIERTGHLHFIELEPFSASVSKRFSGLRRHLAVPLATRLGRQVLTCLDRGDAWGAIEGLSRLRQEGLTTLAFSGRTLSAQSLACLQRLLREMPDILHRYGISAFDFSDAVVEGGLEPWLAVMRQHMQQGGTITLLDCSGTQLGVADASGVVVSIALQKDDLKAIADFVEACPSLRELQLNRQPGLSGWMTTLARSVQQLSLRGCALGLGDLEWLIHAMREREKGKAWGSGLQCIDLRDNDGLFTPADRIQSRRSVDRMTKIVVHLIGNQSLQALYLPANAIKVLFEHDEVAFALMFFLDPSVQSLQLQTLEPFLSSGAELDERFSELKWRIWELFSQREQSSKARQQLERLIRSAGCAVGQCVERHSATAVIGCLRSMQDLGMQASLDLSYMTLRAEHAACLTEVLEQQPGLMARTITGFDFSCAALEGGLALWLDVLQRQVGQGGVVEVLNLACSTSKADTIDDSGKVTRSPLSAVDIKDIAEFVALCPALRKLDLSGQTNLLSHWELIAQAIGAGAVTTVKFWFCDLRLAHAERLMACALSRRQNSGLRVIDLVQNDDMFEGQTSFAVIALVEAAVQNPDLEELLLPDTLEKLFNNDQSAAELTQIIQQSGHTKLTKLYPFMYSSKSRRFAQLQQYLKTNANRPKT